MRCCSYIRRQVSTFCSFSPRPKVLFVSSLSPHFVRLSPVSTFCFLPVSTSRIPPLNLAHFLLDLIFFFLVSVSSVSSPSHFPHFLPHFIFSYFSPVFEFRPRFARHVVLIVSPRRYILFPLYLVSTFSSFFLSIITILISFGFAQSLRLVRFFISSPH